MYCALTKQFHIQIYNHKTEWMDFNTKPFLNPQENTCYCKNQASYHKCRLQTDWYIWDDTGADIPALLGPTVLMKSHNVTSHVNFREACTAFH